MVHAVLEDFLHPQGRVVGISRASQCGREFLTPGDHIASSRCGYWHHGIYVGDGRVVHYAGLSTSLQRGPVEEVSLEEFAHGRGLVVVSQSFSTYQACEVVIRARSRLGESRYGILTNNCEHFCTWCVTGESRSEQVKTCMSHPFKLVRLLVKLLRARMLRSAGGAVNPSVYA